MFRMSQKSRVGARYVNWMIRDVVSTHNVHAIQAVICS